MPPSNQQPMSNQQPNSSPSNASNSAPVASTGSALAADSLDPNDMQALEDVALSLMGNMMQSHRLEGYNDRTIARQAFRMAKAFLDVSKDVAAGRFDPGEVKPLVLKPIEIPVYRQTQDEKWQTVKDPTTQRVVTESVLPDPYAYAPNLMPDHPINLRFQPQDGIPIEGRIERFKNEREQARMQSEAALN